MRVGHRVDGSARLPWADPRLAALHLAGLGPPRPDILRQRHFPAPRIAGSLYGLQPPLRRGDTTAGCRERGDADYAGVSHRVLRGRGCIGAALDAGSLCVAGACIRLRTAGVLRWWQRLRDPRGLRHTAALCGSLRARGPRGFDQPSLRTECHLCSARLGAAPSDGRRWHRRRFLHERCLASHESVGGWSGRYRRHCAIGADGRARNAAAIRRFVVEPVAYRHELPVRIRVEQRRLGARARVAHHAPPRLPCIGALARPLLLRSGPSSPRWWASR